MADIAHKETDAILEALEKKLTKEYNQAVVDTQAKLDDYLRRFEIKDEKWRLMVANGEKTKEQYQQWRTGQIMIGQRWEEMRNSLAEDYHNTNVIARGMIDNNMPEVYALNHNYSTFQVEKGSMVDTSYTLYDRETVELLARDNPELLQPVGKNLAARIAAGQDIAWQEGQIQSVTLQTILQGESIPNMAARIARTMGETNHKNTIRYARTSVTSAENQGRLDGYQRASDMGIKMRQTWVATLDGRTRHEHRMLDGQTVDIDEPFTVDGYELRFPADPQAPAYLVWNCRCTTIAQVKGFERDVTDLGLRRNEKLGDMSYEEWKEAHATSQDILRQEQVSVEMRNRFISEYEKSRNTLYGGRKKDYNRPADQKEIEKAYKEFEKRFAEWNPDNLAFSGVSKETIDGVRYEIATMDRKQAEKWKQFIGETAYFESQIGESYCKEGIVYLTKDAKVSTVLHETGHAIDSRIRFDKDVYGIGVNLRVSPSSYVDALVEKAVDAGNQSDIVTLCKAIGFKMNDSGDWISLDNPEGIIDTYKAWANKCLATCDNGVFSRVNDTVDGITQSDITFALRRFGSHDLGYYKQSYGGESGSWTSMEAWANYCALRAMGSTEGIKIIEGIAPNMLSALSAVYKEVFGL